MSVARMFNEPVEKYRERLNKDKERSHAGWYLSGADARPCKSQVYECDFQAAVHNKKLDELCMRHRHCCIRHDGFGAIYLRLNTGELRRVDKLCAKEVNL